MIKNLQDILISPTSSIREALEIISIGAHRSALVIDDKNNLLGIVTDGDVRRGLLKGLALTNPVETVMNKKPLTLPYPADKKQALALMEAKSILSIPVLKGEELVGLETIHDAMSATTYENPVFIMAGGFGTRLRPLTDNCPKPMLEVGDKPILETVILQFKKNGFKNFYISTHFLPEVIMDHFGDGSKFGVNVTYVHEDSPLGTGGALSLLPESTPKLPLIMINGDVLTKLNFKRLLKFHNQNDACATMCVREYDYQIPYGVINSDGIKITSMVEKPTHTFFVNTGIYVLEPEVFADLELNQIIDLPTLLEQQIDNDKNVFLYPLHEYWLDIGRMDDFKKAQVDIETLGLID
ncbi:nucleotidyltransferase family protein [Thalassotalea crassostreae]|uniref:nucleotidyltransferase family protein n=1 Tax=Thalassotalea crassostreae TaxID=1763536 RepID=UPI000838D154|nr:nucleotidyltransferase family protein [Thalassotalea crassostreae]